MRKFKLLFYHCYYYYCYFNFPEIYSVLSESLREEPHVCMLL